MDQTFDDDDKQVNKEFDELSKDTVKGAVPLISLEDDFFKIPGQAYAVLSFIDQSQYQGARLEGVMSAPMHLIKLRGVFSSVEAAEKHVKQCQSVDTYFDYHIVETHKWTTIGASKGDEQVWADKDMHEAMQDYFEKDNDTLANIERRIKLSQDGNERSDETSSFWKSAQKTGKPNNVHEIPGTLQPMNLREAANYNPEPVAAT